MDAYTYYIHLCAIAETHLSVTNFQHAELITVCTENIFSPMTLKLFFSHPGPLVARVIYYHSGSCDLRAHHLRIPLILRQAISDTIPVFSI